MLGVFTSLLRNVLHFLVHLNFKLSKVQQNLKIPTSCGDPGSVDPPTGVQPELAGTHRLCMDTWVLGCQLQPGTEALAGVASEEENPRPLQQVRMRSSKQSLPQSSRNAPRDLGKDPQIPTGTICYLKGPLKK